jgi:hypothetical protein
MRHALHLLILIVTIGFTVGCGGSDSDRESTSPTNSPSPSSSTVTTPPSTQCVGTWQCSEEYLDTGIDITITWHTRPDGTCTYTFTLPDGTSETKNSSWRFSDGVLYETLADGSKAKARIEFSGTSKMKLTIIDNGVPASSGKVRNYKRL